MAVPHVAGVAAVYLATHPEAPPSEVMRAIIGSATPGRLASGDMLPGTPNLLLYSRI
jgi:subtilisin family serine protease